MKHILTIIRSQCKIKVATFNKFMEVGFTKTTVIMTTVLQTLT